MIYLLEDDENIRKLVCYALTKEGYETKGFETPPLFYKAMNENLPELIMLDIMLPEEDGLSVLKRLRSDNATALIPIMMLTAKGSEFDKVTGLDSGADDYVTKPVGMTELISRVRALLRRTARNSDGIYKCGAVTLDDKRHTVTVSGKEEELSFKEYSLLLKLLAAKGAAVTREELLDSVWGQGYGESRTLDVHIRKLRQKLAGAGDIIKTVKNVGYRIGGDLLDR